MKLRIYKPKYESDEFIEKYRDDFRRFPRMDNWKYFVRPVLQGIWAKICRKQVTDKEIAVAKKVLLNYLQFEYCCGDTDMFAQFQAGLEQIWSNLVERFKRSYAAYVYFEDYAVGSPSLGNFMSWVPASETMENARGMGYNLAGKYGPLEISDVAFFWSLRTPVLAGICLRIQYGQELILLWIARQKALGKRVRLLLIGAGRMAELRSYLAELSWFDDLEIVAVDEDEGVRSNIDELFQYKYGKTTEELGFTWIDRRMTEEQVEKIEEANPRRKHRYYNMSFDEFEKISRYNGYFDLILVDGVMSYYRKNTPAMLLSIRSLMGDAGNLVFDLQIMNLLKDWSFLQHKFSLTWETTPQLDPDLSVKSAYKRITKACNEVGLTMKDAVIYPADSGKRAVEIGVGFTLQRQANWGR